METLTDPMIGGIPKAAPPARNKGGRPRGSKTDPAKKAAARRRSRPDAATTPADDVLAQFADAAVPPDAAPKGGRPSTDERGRTKLARSLATGYEGFGGLLQAGGAILAGINPTVGGRLVAVGQELRANAEKCGTALARWADSNPRVKDWLDNLATGSGAILVLAAHAPIIAAAAGYGAMAPLVGAVADGMTGADGAPDVLGAFLGMMGPAAGTPAAA